MNKICILDTKTLGKDVDLSILNKFGEVTLYETTKPDEVVDRIKDQNIILTNKVLLNESNLKSSTNLKLVCITATGTNNIDLEYAKKAGIAVTNVAGYSTKSVVQHTFAMLLYLIEHLNYYDCYVKDGKYSNSTIFTHLNMPFPEISGKTWGIIGLGEIGRNVAEIASAFGCKVIYYSTSGKNNNLKYKKVELDELLKFSDIVSIHAPLNEQTKDLITYKQIKEMKKNAVLLNLGRGGIVNEKDLALALDEELISGAGVDVLEVEPINENNPLLKVKDKDKLLITPHIAWASKESVGRLINDIVLNIEAFLNNEIRNRVC